MDIVTWLDRDVLLAALALAASLALLALYMRAVRRSMMRAAGATPAAAAIHESAPATAPSAKLEMVRPDPPARSGVWTVWAGPLRSAAIQLVAGLVYAAGVTVAWVWLAAGLAGWQGLAWQGFVTFTLFFAWPVVIVVGLVATLSWRAMALVAAVYAAMLLAIALERMQGTAVTPLQFATNWWNINGPATVFVLVLLARPIRAIGPVVAALVVAATAGVVGVAHALDQPTIELIAGIATDLGLTGRLGGTVAGLVVFGMGALVAVLAAYVVLRGVGRLYRSRWVSDQSIQIDAVWLTFAVLQAPSQMPYAGLAAFLVYKLIAELGHRITRPRDAAAAPRLLLLRVFSLGARSGRLFDGFARLWRHTGSVRMIAGPDLANATVEPHEFLDFLGGRLHRRFIASADGLDRRLAETPLQRDRDGRFRVASFYCHADTWQMALRRLARESDRVLMDLRGFTRANEGCAYELNELLDAVPLPRILLVVDATTDEAFLTQVLTRGWSEIAADSPNRGDPAPRVRIHRDEVVTSRGVGRLVATLADARGRNSTTLAGVTP